MNSATGQELTEPTAIARRAVDFFSKLYSSEWGEEAGGAHYFYYRLPKVHVEEELGVDFFSARTLHSLTGHGEREGPGIDGLAQIFTRPFRPVLVAVLNDSLNKESLPLSCRRAVITLLTKKGNPKEEKKLETCAITLHRLQAPL